MVGIVAGNGLGLFNTTGGIFGGFGSSQGGARVNLSNGNLVIQGADQQVSGLGMDLSAVRTYNSLGVSGSTQGWYWEGARKMQLVGTLNTVGSSMIRTDVDGHATAFAYNSATGSYVSAEGSGAHDSVVWDAANAQAVWTEGSSRVVERYNSSGKLVSVTDASGNTHTFAYDANGRLASITDVSGTQIVINYTATGRVNRLDTRATAGGALTQQVYYTYDASGRLSSVATDLTPSDNSIADGAVYTTTYTYDGSSLRVASITQGDGTTVSFTYQLVGADYRVATVTDAAGTTTFTYDTANLRTTVSDGNGRQWIYEYDAAGRLTRVQTPPIAGQRQVASYTYDADGNLVAVTDGLSRTTRYAYDANGNLTLERDALGNTVVRTYTAQNQLQNEVRYAVASTWNGSEWVLPADGQALVRRHVYDANNRVRFVVSAEGAVTEYRYTAAGLTESERRYTAGFDVAGLLPADVLSLAQLEAWAAMSANADIASLVERRYDLRGNLDRQVEYATVTGGTGVLDSAARVTEFVYGEYGQLLQTIAVTGADRSARTVQASYVHDGAGRLVAEVTANGTRTWAYDGAARTTTVSHGSGLVRVETYDAVGRLTSQVESAAGLASRSTAYHHDAAGRLVMIEDATGARTYTFHDEAGRTVGQVDALGGLTETVYNAAGQVTDEIRYATRVDTTAWFDGVNVVAGSLAAIRPAASADDRVVHFGYDSAGRRTTITDAVGTVSTTVYDAAGRVLRTVTGDRITRFFYDKDGRLVAQLDAEGYLTHHVYDRAGNLRQTVRHAGQTAAALRDGGTLAELQASIGSTDVLSAWFFHDALGRKIGEVSEQRYVTTYTYDEAARLQQTVRFVNVPYFGTLSAATDFATILAAMSGNPSAQANASTVQYDASGRVASRTSGDGTVVSYQYDANGRLVQEAAADGTAEARASHYRYDAFGRLVSRLWGEGAAHLQVGMTDSEVAAVHDTYGERYSYDVLGRRAQVVDRAGNATTYYYDDLGRLVLVIDATGGIVESTYNRFGDVAETRAYHARYDVQAQPALVGGRLTTSLKALVEGIRDAARDVRVQTAYDTRGLVAQRTDGLGYRTRYEYNLFGELQKAEREQAAGVFAADTYTYSKRGELLTKTGDAGGLNATTSTTYDAFGRVVNVVDATGRVTGTQYLEGGRLVVETDGLGQSRQRTYDALGRVLVATDALGNSTTYAYDDALRTLTVTTPEGVVTRTENNRHGQAFRITDGNGHVTTHQYNLDGDLTTTVGADAVVALTQEYDAAGRVQRTLDAAGGEVTYSYDALNRVMFRTEVASGNVTEYRYDAIGRQVTVIEAKGTAAERVTAYAYDQASHVLSVTVDPEGLAQRTTYTYDGEGRQLSVARGTSVDPNLQVTYYTYDALGRMQSERTAVLPSAGAAGNVLAGAGAPAVVTSGNAGLQAGASEAVTTQVTGYTQSAATLLNGNLAGSANFPAVTRLANGQTLVAWTLDNGSGWRAQRYDANGVAVGSEIVLNTVAGGGASTRNLDVSVAGLTGGGFVAVWTNRNAAGTDAGNVYLRRFDSNGVALDAAEVQVNATATDYVNGTTTYTQRNARVLALANGNFVVSWESPKSNLALYENYYRVYGADGSTVRAATRNDSASSSNTAINTSLTLLSAGSFLVSWWQQGVQYGRVYGSDGVNQTGRKQLLNGPSSSSMVRIASLANGGFALVVSGSMGLGCAVYDANADQVSGPVTLVAAPTSGSLGAHAVQTDGAGFAVLFELVAVGGASTALMAQRFTNAGVADGVSALVDQVQGQHAFAVSSVVEASGVTRVVWSETAAAGTAGIHSRVLTSVYGAAATVLDNPDQVLSRTARLADGGYVVAWPMDGNLGWRAQRFSADGVKVGSEIVLNARPQSGYTTRSLELSIAGLVGGGFVATWANNNDVFARRFDANGNALDAEEFRVNGNTADLNYNGNFYAQSQPEVIALADGGYAIAWHHPYKGSGGNVLTSVMLRTYRPAAGGGWTTGNEVAVDSVDAYWGTRVSLAELSNGKLVVGYVAQGSLYTMLVNANGSSAGARVPVASASISGTAFQLAALSTAGYVVAWKATQTATSIMARAYDGAGVAIAGTSATVATTTGSFGSVSVAATQDGGYVVACDVQDATGPSRVDVRRFRAEGAQVGNAVTLESTGDLYRFAPSLCLVNDGRVIASFSSPGANGAPGIYARALALPGGTPTVAESASGAVSSAALAGGGYVVAWATSSAANWYAQRYAADGQAVGAVIALNSQVASGQQQDRKYVSVTGLSSGGFVASWVNGNDIYARRFDANGQAIGAEAIVNTTTADVTIGSTLYTQAKPAVVALAGGAYAVVWQSPVAGTSTYRLAMQRFNADGTRAGSEQFVDQGLAQVSAESARVTALEGGAYAIDWQSVSASGSERRVRVYDGAGNALGAERVLGTVAASAQAIRLAALAGGGFVALQSAPGNDGALMARRHAQDGTPVDGDWVQAFRTESGEQVRAWSVAGAVDGGYLVTVQVVSADGQLARTRVLRFGEGHLLDSNVATVQVAALAAAATPLSVLALAGGDAILVQAASDAATGVARLETQRVDIAAAPAGPATATLQTQYRHDAQGRITRRIDALGNSAWTVYDAAGRVSHEIDAIGGLTGYTYDASGRLLSRTRYANPVTGLALLGDQPQASDLQLPVADAARDQRVSYLYDADGRLVAEVDSLRQATRYRYDGAGNRVEIRALAAALPSDPATWLAIVQAEPAGLSTRRVFDALNRQRYELDAEGYVTEWRYDLAGRVTDKIRYADPVAAGTSLLESELQAAVAGLAYRQTTYVYDLAGRALYEVTRDSGVAVGAIVARDYDARGAVLAEHAFAAPEGMTNVTRDSLDTARLAATEVRTTRFVRDVNGQVVYTINATGRALQHVHDALGNLVETRQYENAIALAGNPSPVAVRDALALVNTADNVRVTRIVRDAIGRERFVVDALGNVTEKVYDALGHVVVERTYDTRRVDGTGHYVLAVTLTDFTESALVDVLATLPAQSRHVTQYAYDAAGRLRYTLDAAGYLSEVRYDATGHVLAQIRYGARVAWDVAASPAIPSLDALQAVAAAQTESRSERFVYDANGALRYRIDAAGYVTEQVRDAHGQVLRETRYENPVQLAGQPAASAVATAMAGMAGRSTHYRYDGLGRAIIAVDALGYATRREFDAWGSAIVETHHAQALSSAVSDMESTAALAARVDLLATGASRTRTWSYDAFGRVEQEVSPQATFWLTPAGATVPQPVTGHLKTSYEYDGFGNLKRQTEGEIVAADGTVVDASGARTTVHEYDALGRRTATVAPGWYDRGDNRFYKEMEGQSDRFQVRTEALYDGFGNVVRERVVTNVVGTTVTYAETYRSYDALNRLRYEVDALGFVTESIYDGFGNLASTVRYYSSLTQGEYPIASPGVRSDSQMESLCASLATPDDRVLTMTYDVLGRKTSVSQATVSVYEYKGDNTTGNGTAVVSGLGASAVVGYADVTGSSTTGKPSVSWTYNAWGDQTKESVAGGPSTFHYYDALGRKTATIDGAGYATLYTYVAETDRVATRVEVAEALTGTWSGQTITVNTQTARSYAFGYDALLRLVGTQRLNASWWVASAGQTGYVQASGALTVSAVEYDAFGNALASVDAAGNRTVATYDALDRVTQVTEPARRTAKPAGELGIDPFWKLYSDGRLVNENSLSASPEVTFGYDQFGQLVSQRRSAADGQAGLTQESFTTYDFAGNVIRTQDAGGGVVQFRVDAQGRTIEESQVVHQDYVGWTGAATQTQRTRYTYDALGRQLSTTRGYGADNATTESAAYNAFGEIHSKYLNDFRQEVVSYDRAGRIIARTAADGTTYYDYDLAGRQTRVWRSDGAAGTVLDRITVTVYDVLGRAIEQRLPKFKADVAVNTDASVTEPQTDVIPLVRQTFDRWGNVLSRTDARGYTTTWTYDADNRVLTETLAATEVKLYSDTPVTQAQVHTKRYDALGNLVVEVDGVKNADNSYTELRSRQNFYNAVGQLIKDIDATGIVREYAVDAHGNQVAVKDGVGTIRYTDYDAMNRVVETGILRRDTGDVAVTGELVASVSHNSIGGSARANPFFGNIPPVSMATDSVSLADGRYLVAWVDGGSSAVRATIYQPGGTTYRASFLLSAASDVGTECPFAISAIDTPENPGGFAVSWVQGGNVYLKRFNSSGYALDTNALQVNGAGSTDTTKTPRNVAMATLTDGSVVVTWRLPQSNTIWYKRFSAAGVALTADIQVSDSATAITGAPSVVALANGKFSIAYSSSSATYARVFPATVGGAPGAQLVTSNGGISTAAKPAIVELLNGTLVSVWARTDGQTIVAQAFTAAGVKVGTEQVLAVSDQNSKFDSSVSVLATRDGGYVVGYEMFHNTTGKRTSWLVRHDQNGVLAAPRKEVSSYAGYKGEYGLSPAGFDAAPELVMLANGQLLATWSDVNQTIGQSVTYSSQNVRARVFDDTSSVTDSLAAYAAMTSTQFGYSTQLSPAMTQVSAASAGAPSLPQTAVLAGGGFVSVWTSADGTWRAQRVADDGTAVGSELVLNTVARLSTQTTALEASVCALPDGGFIASWCNGGNLYVRRYAANGQPVDAQEVLLRAANPSLLESYAAVEVVALSPSTSLPDGGYLVAWQRNVDRESYVEWQRFSASGVAQGVAYTLPHSGGGDPRKTLISVSAMGDGGFALCYRTNGNDGEFSIFNAAGTLRGISIFERALNSDVHASLTQLSDGQYVVVWGSGGSREQLYAVRYSATGNSSSSATTVSANGDILGFQVSAGLDGGYAIAYSAHIGTDAKLRTAVQYFSGDAYADSADTTILEIQRSSSATMGVSLMRRQDGSYLSLIASSGDSANAAGVYTRGVGFSADLDYAVYRQNVKKFALQSYLYDEAGQRYAEVRGDDLIGAGTRASNVRYSKFDERGNVISTRNESGIVQTAYFDLNNRKFLSSDGVKSEMWLYDDYGRIKSYYNKGGLLTTYEYDTAFGELFRETSDSFKLNPDNIDNSAGLQNTAAISGISQLAVVEHSSASAAVPALDKAVIYSPGSVVLSYAYYGNGLLKSITTDMGLDAATGNPQDLFSSLRVYDANGSVVREASERKRIDTQGSITSLGSHDVRYRLDALGRLAAVTSPVATESRYRDSTGTFVGSTLTSNTYYYDSFGNRRVVKATVVNPGGATTTVEDWYDYDLEGRMTVAEGMLRNGKVVAGEIGTSGKGKGVTITYDAAGRRASEEVWAKSAQGVDEQPGVLGWQGTYYELFKSTQFVYNDLGNVVSETEVNRLRANGDDSSAAIIATDILIYDTDNTFRSSLRSVLREQSNYDSFGRLMDATAYRMNGSALGNHRYFYRGDGQLVLQQDFVDATKVLASQLVFDEASMRDAAGNQLAYRYEDFTGNGMQVEFEQTYRTTYAVFSDYKPVVVTVSKNGAMGVGQPGFGYTTFDYTSRGELVEATSRGGTYFDRYFTSNRFGQMIMRHDNVGNGDQVQTYYYRDGSELLNAGKLDSLNLGNGFESVAKTDLGLAPSTYLVNEGDTFASIAAAIYGDGDYAYLIADANGMAIGATLVEGTSLLIPNVLTNAYNAFDTIKPYSQADVVGDTTPTPKPPPPPKKKSKALKQLVMVVVAVVATVLTAGAAAGALAPGLTTALGSTWAAGSAVLAGTAGVGLGVGLTAGVAGAMVGSAVSQLVGDKWLGVGEFSWSAVGRAGVSSLLTAGLSSAFNGITGLDAAVELNSASNWTRVAAAAQAGVASFGSSYLTSRLYGDQPSFSWQALAGSAIMAGAAKGGLLEFGDRLGLGGRSWYQEVGRNVAIGAIQSGGVDKWFGGSTPDYAEIAVNSIGQFIGNAAVGRFAESARRGQSTSLVAGGQDERAEPGATPMALDLDIIQAPESASDFDRWLAGDLELPDYTHVGMGPKGMGYIEVGDDIHALEQLARRIDPDNPYAVMASLVAENGLKLDAKGNPVFSAGQVLAYREASALSAEALVAADKAGRNLTAYNTARTAQYVAEQEQAARAASWQYVMDVVRGGRQPEWDEGLSVGERALARGGEGVTAADYAVGTAEMVLGGIYNSGVRLGGALASIPYLVDSVDAAVAVQEGMSSRFSYVPSSDGAVEIMDKLSPVAAYASGKLASLRAYGEEHAGLGVTAISMATLAIGAEVASLSVPGGSSLRILGRIDGAAPPLMPSMLRPIDGAEVRVFDVSDGAVNLEKFEAHGLKAERVLPGTNGKVAVIGRTMGNENLKGVRDYAGALREKGVDVEIFDGNMISEAAQREFSQLTAGGRRLSNQELMQTMMYQENKSWALKLKTDGYTVIDIGNPYPTKSGFSPFYAAEKKTFFWGGN